MDIYSLFKEQVIKTPHNVALFFEGDEMTYEELDSRVIDLANNFEKNSNHLKRIGLLFRNPINFVIAALATLRAGLCYVPLSEKMPQDRINFISQDCGLKVIFSDIELNNLKSGTKKETFNYVDQLNTDNYIRVEKELGDADAYVIYTSGSTGKPKGVPITQNSICNTLQWRKTEYGLDSSTVQLQTFSFIFDGSVSSLFSVLISGGRIVLVKETNLGDIDYLRSLINSQGVTNLFMVPSLLSALLDIVDESDFWNIKCVTTGGEKLQKSILNNSIILNKKIEVVNEYGPTENSVTSTFLRRASLLNYGSIGYPITGCSLIVMADGKESNKGELCVSGIGLTRGYLNKDDLNYNVFFYYGGKRYYRTGDIVEKQKDDSIKFIGRKDYQVKLNGYRIELEEIESVILECNLVTNAAVIVKNNQLIAFISRNENNEQVVSQIKGSIKNKLPNYMIPSKYIELEEFPINLSGKIDRNELKNYFVPSSDKIIYAETSLEKEIHNIWQQYLQVSNFGVTDNLFELGGDSLTAGRIAGNLNKKYSVNIRISDIFNNPTVRNLAIILDKQLEKLVRKKRVNNNLKSGILESQKGIFFYQQRFPESTAYNNPFYIKIPSDIDNNTIEVAYNRLLLSQENLRKLFVLDGSEINSFVREFCYQSIEVCTFEDEINNKKFEEEIISFDLGKDQLVRSKIFQNKTEKFLFLDIHHIVFDGESLNILIKELYNYLYSDSIVNEASKFNYNVSSNIVNQNWWRQYIESGFLKPSQFKTEKSTRSIIKHRKGLKISKKLVTKLFVEDKNNITNNSVLLSVFLIVLSRFLQEKELLIGIPFSNREIDNSKIGMYVNTLPLNIAINEDKSFKEFSYDIQKLIFDLYENKEISIEEILDQIKEKNDTDFKNGLFDIVFSSQVYDPNIPLQYKLLNHTNAKFPFIFTITENEEDYLIKVEAVDFKNAEQIIQNFITVFENIIYSLSNNVDQKISSIEVYSFEHLGIRRVGGVKDYRNLLDVFSNIVNEYPEKIALKFGDKCLTYRELDRHSSSLANILDKQGVRNGDRVGIYLDKGIDFIISMLAILKLGACYVPIDTNYPDNRKQYIIDNSKLQAVLFNDQKFIYDIFAGIKINVSDYKNKRCDFIPRAVDSKQPAYIIYTSGSTGNPKGVVVNHHNILSLLFPVNNNFHFSHKDVWTAFHSFCFDFSVWEIYGALLYGGMLVIVPDKVTKDPFAFSSLLLNEEVTILNQTPSAFYVFSEVNKNVKFTNLRYVIFGGEKLNPARLSQWNSVNPKAKLINMYGITEITVHATYKELQKSDLLTNKSNIGKVLDTLGYIILDKDGHLVPRGVVGELYLYGHGISNGYFNSQQLTNERFIVHPFLNDKVLYKTGDLVIEGETGDLEYIDRIDSQVKLRGYRIELGEIERVICKHSLVTNCKVIVDENDNLVCFIESKFVSKQEMVGYAKKNLTTYMQPTQFIICKQFPITSNGKVDLDSLKIKYKNSVVESYIGENITLTKEQSIVKNIWTTVLGVDSFGVEDIVD